MIQTRRLQTNSNIETLVGRLPSFGMEQETDQPADGIRTTIINRSLVLGQHEAGRIQSRRLQTNSNIETLVGRLPSSAMEQETDQPADGIRTTIINRSLVLGQHEVGRIQTRRLQTNSNIETLVGRLPSSAMEQETDQPADGIRTTIINRSLVLGQHEAGRIQSRRLQTNSNIETLVGRLPSSAMEQETDQPADGIRTTIINRSLVLGQHEAGRIQTRRLQTNSNIETLVGRLPSFGKRAGLPAILHLLS